MMETPSVTSGQACNTDAQSTSQDLDACEDKLWVNDVTMSDITRAVSAFITDPGSSTHGRAFPKIEPDEDLTLDGLLRTSNSCNEDLTLEGLLRTSNICSRPNDRTKENVTLHDEVANSRNYIAGCSRGLKSSTSMKRAVIVCKDLTMPTEAAASAGDNSQLNYRPLTGKDTRLKAVDSSNLPPRRNLRSNTIKRQQDCEDARPTESHNLEMIEINKSKTTDSDDSSDSTSSPVREDSDDSSDSTSSPVRENSDGATWFEHPRNQQQVKCNVCGNTYDNGSLLESHITTHPGIVYFICKIDNCKRNYSRPTKELWVKHTSKYHAGKPIHYSLKVIMNPRPTTSACKGPFVCHLGPKRDCNLKFPSKRQLDKHMKTNHKGEVLYCWKCGKTFGRLHLLEQHDNVHKGVKPYRCKFCGKKFHTNLEKHTHVALKHLSRKEVQCEICGSIGKGDKYLLNHIKTVHRKERFPCKECTDTFRFPRHLKDHMRLHRGEPRYKCDLCGQTFLQKFRLTDHIRRHSLRFTCPKCDKVFASKNFLQGHLLQHDGIKKFCCKICGKTFAHQHYLFSHMKSHGEKLFECAICGGKFNRKDNLKSHIIRHQTTGRKNLKKT